jgi:hypothetical protein
MLVVRMMIQCVTDLDHIPRGNPGEIEQIRTRALFDCFHGNGFIAKACHAMDYDAMDWRRLAAGYLRGTVDHIGLNKRIVAAANEEAA